MGQQLERGRRGEGASASRRWLTKAGIFVGLVLITLLAFPRGEVYEYTMQVGDVWLQQALVAPFDFPVYKDRGELEAERRAVRQSTPPYFREVPDARARLAANRDSLSAQLQETFEAYAASWRHRQAGEAEAAAEDSLRYVELRRSTRLKQLAAEQWQRLARDYANRQPGLAAAVPGEVPPGPPLWRGLLDSAWEAGVQFLSIGVLNVPRDSVHTDELVVRNEEERTDRVRSKDNVYGLDEAYRSAQEAFAQEYADAPSDAALANAFFGAVFQPSLTYQRAETLREWRREAGRIAPTRGAVQEGQVLVRKGDRIDAEIKRQLTSLERAQNERSGRSVLWKQVLGEAMLALAAFLIFFLYLFFLRREVFDSNRTVFLIALLFAGIIGLFALVLRLPSVGLYVVPVAIASVQLTILFDSRVGLFGTLVLALVGGLLLGFDLEYFMATFFAGMLGVFSVRDIKNRGQYFISGGLVLLGYVFVLTAAWLFFNTDTDQYLSELGLVVANSFFVVMAYPLLWVFERSFDLTTDLTLLELSDTNRKLLKELSLRAPGSFNHSLQVANLAEAAADRVGANSLLTRVGALYHDIGKMLKPEYFVENQRTGMNPHDKLKPRMSALIIASHVKEGLEMARQHNLPQRVLDFIPMHHGTTRIEFFYRKALEAKAPDDPDLLESEFRYPGPRPHSRETAILMLADGVEAASRSLEDPTHKRLQALIDAIFQARIDDDQFTDTDLTFRDMRVIKETFLTMLMGIYHVRVKYPDQEEKKTDAAPDTEAPPSDEEEPPAAQAPPSEAESALAEKMKEENLWGVPEQDARAAPGQRNAGGQLKPGDGASGGASEEDADSAPDPAAPEAQPVSEGDGTQQPPQANGHPETQGDGAAAEPSSAEEEEDRTREN